MIQYEATTVFKTVWSRGCVRGGMSHLLLVPEVVTVAVGQRRGRGPPHHQMSRRWVLLPPPPPVGATRWVACERCSKWRRLDLPRNIAPEPGWHCGHSGVTCAEPEEAWDETEEWNDKLEEPWPELGPGWFKVTDTTVRLELTAEQKEAVLSTFRRLQREKLRQSVSVHGYHLT